MVVDSFRQSGVEAFLYRKVPIIALAIFCPPSGGAKAATTHRLSKSPCIFPQHRRD